MTLDELFDPGKVRATPAAEELRESGIDLESYLSRHVSGDWGDIGAEVKTANDQAVETGEGVMASAYGTPLGWLLVITETDQSKTTFLVPSDVPRKE